MVASWAWLLSMPATLEHRLRPLYGEFGGVGTDEDPEIVRVFTGGITAHAA